MNIFVSFKSFNDESQYLKYLYRYFLLQISSEHLIYLLLRCTNDTEDHVAFSASYYLSNVLKKATPKIFSQRMLGAIFFFNGLLGRTRAPGANTILANVSSSDPLQIIANADAAPGTYCSVLANAGKDSCGPVSGEPDGFDYSLRGLKNQEYRMRIYAFMASQIDDAAKLRIIDILIAEVIGESKIGK